MAADIARLAERLAPGSASVNTSTQIQAVHRFANERPGVLYGESAAVSVDVRQVVTRWVVQNPEEGPTVDFGQEVALTAVLQRESLQGRVPFAGRSGGVFEPSSGGQFSVVGQFTTGQDGRIAFTHAPGETGAFRLPTISDDPFVAAVSTQSPVVRVQYSRDGTSWTDVTTVEAHRSGEDHAFSADIAAPKPASSAPTSMRPSPSARPLRTP